MNAYQRRKYRKQSQAAAAGYVPAADCIGKEFVFSAFIYRVVKYHPRKGTFTCERINAFNQPLELDETFVRHYCTPVTATLPQPGRRDASDYSPQALRRRLFPPIVEPAQDRFGNRDNSPAVVDNGTIGVNGNTPKAPEYYLDQMFTFTSGDSTFNVRVQLYNERRNQFLLYEPDGCSGSFYRDAAFVYAHCQPAETPVVRQSFPKIEIDKRRFLNLLSITDPLHPLYPLLKSEGDES